MKARGAWIDVLQSLRDHGCKPRLLYPDKLSFTINGENKIFHDKNRFKQYISTNPALQKVVEGKRQHKKAKNIHITQTYDNCPLTQPKEGKHTNITTKKNDWN